MQFKEYLGKDKYKHLTIQIIDEIQDKFFELLLKKFGKSEHGISDIINVIISVHLSSMFSSMIMVSQEYKNIHDEVKKFINNLQNFIESQEVIKKVEISNKGINK